ncbi:hypothetical protein DITRI_Ditri19aG0087300 [Diplodiscus trichospermus]
MASIENNPPRFHQEVEMIPNIQYNMLQLYDAALKGSVATFTTLIRNDPLILHRISLTSFTETPLHISALAGHLEFTEALLAEKSQLATRLDSRNRSPLHLASAEGHTEVVKALLCANLDVCLVPDEEGRIPLHLAVMRGQVEVIQELINAQPNSVLEKLHGDSVLHLAVKYNQLKALRQLVTQLNDQYEIFDFTDHQGNTILHSAVMLKQSETITYLVSVPKIKAKINALNKMSLSALGLLEHHPRDFTSPKIGDALIGAGCRRSTEDPNPPNKVPTQSQLVPVVVGGETQVKEVKPRLFNSSWLKEKTKSAHLTCHKYLTHQANWVEEMQGTLMLVATLSATIAFQVAINPPGGVLGFDYRNSTIGNFNCATSDVCVDGTALLGYVYPEKYIQLTVFAIVSFIASLAVVLLAISGLPLKNKLGTWLMIIAMIIAITSLFLAFIVAIWMVTPNDVFPTTSKALFITQYIWIVLVGFVVVFASMRLLFRLVHFLGRLIHFLWKMGNKVI